MFNQLKFYIKHSLNDLNINRRLTFFALLSIAAGVAAIVSLQTLSLMIGDTLEQNLQETNRGDVSASISGPSEEEEEAYNVFVEDGVLSLEEISFFGETGETYALAPEGLEAIETWIAESPYAGQVEITYQTPIAEDFDIIIGSGSGTTITIAETGEQAPQLTPYVIDPAVYPFYGEITTLDGQLLADVLQAPNDIVIGENVTELIDVAVGDSVLINGANEPFIVRGIVSIEAAVQNPLEDIFAGLFGFYMVSHDAIPLFDSVNPKLDSFYFQLNNPTLTSEFNEALSEEFIFFNTTSTDDLRVNNEELVDQLSQLSTVMGMISLLIGSIGIINTMQVLVRRRMLEVAILKTLGMQGEQITGLFLTEAFLLGVIGGLVGIVLGWGGTFLIKGVAESIFATTLTFRIAPFPAISGFVVGITAATIFGFQPTLAAAQVRPAIVIRPQEGVVPRAGIIQSLLAISLIVIVISIFAQLIIGGNYVNTLLGVVLAFVIIGLLYVFFQLIIWLIAKFTPTFGLVDLKVALRQMEATKGRGASTLLALVVGVFSLSTITLFADAITGVLTEALEGSGGNVIISVQDTNQLTEVQQMLDGLDGVNSHATNLGYQLELVSWENAETGDVYTPEDLPDYVESLEINFPPAFGVPEADMEDFEEERSEIQQAIVASSLISPEIEAHEITEIGDANMIEGGRDLTPDDMTSETAYIVFEEDPIILEMGLSAGDTVTYNIISQSAFGTSSSTEVTFEVAGIKKAGVSISFNSGSYVPASVIPEGTPPSTISVFADVADEQLPALRRELADIPGTFALETAIFTRLITSLLGTFTAFPSLVAALGLIVGGVVIANSVALATMERRSEIAVMKAVGLQRERVLGMILLENGILGLIGGLIGVGSGLVAVIILAQQADVPFSAIPWLSAFNLMMLCVGVAVFAAITSAWSASGEKPLNVLRYE